MGDKSRRIQGQEDAFIGKPKSIVEIDADGKQLNTTPIDSIANALYVANFDLDGVPEFVVIGDRSEAIAYSSSGSRLWSHTFAGSITRACVADLDADGLDEVLIGINGGDVEIFDNDGSSLCQIRAAGAWGMSPLSNQQGITDVAIFEDSRRQVPWISDVAIVDTHCSTISRREIALGVSGCLPIRSDEDAGRQKVLIWGYTANSSLGAALVGADGQIEQSCSVANDDRGNIFLSGDYLPKQGLLAAGLRNGEVRVLSFKSSKLIGSYGNLGIMQVGWIWSHDDKPVLIVTTGSDTYAFDVRKDDD